MKYSEFLRHIASLIVTINCIKRMEAQDAGEGFYYSAWICNTISGRLDSHSVKLRKAIKRKIEAKKGKGSTATFTALIGSFDQEVNKQYRINWLLSLAEVYELKGN